MVSLERTIRRHRMEGKPVWLFLDYDGTLAEFSPTPEVILPNPQVIDLLTRLERRPLLRVSVISGRSLASIEKLLPVQGILLAGTYGIELYFPEGKRESRVRLETVRPTLEKLKSEWERISAGQKGIFLEDKGWAIALHALRAGPETAERVLTAAHQAAERLVSGTIFRMLIGQRFLEVGSSLTNKGETVLYLLRHFPLPEALPVILGDDERDEEAFEVVKDLGGFAVQVGCSHSPTVADKRLKTPQQCLLWLEEQFI